MGILKSDVCFPHFFCNLHGKIVNRSVETLAFFGRSEEDY